MKEKLHFEESIVDIFGGDANQMMERPLSNGVFIVIAIGAGMIILAAAIRVFLLAGVWNDLYARRAVANVTKEVILPAQRGLIFDRFNQPLLRNIPSFSVSLAINALLKENQEQKTEAVVTTAAQYLADILHLNVADIVQKIQETDLESADHILIARDITLEQAIALKTLNRPEIEVLDDYKRDYMDGGKSSHIIGYTGVGEKSAEVVGVSGLESYYNDSLRGQDGGYVILRDARGTAIDTKVLREARPGHQLITTIDGELQKYFYDRLQQGLKELGRTAGVGLAMNPQTGEVLALVNIPSFDNNAPAEYLTVAHQPLFNRAVSGLYNPGSTIKPLVALAALKEHIVSPDWQIYSKGYLELPNPYAPDKPSRFLDWRAHGWVDLHSALARSSNVYFYALGGGCVVALKCDIRPWAASFKGLGIEKLREYWKKFALDQPTGVDLGGEAVGVLPDPVEKERRTGQPWRIGDTYNASIGQGDLSITPLRLLTFISSIANGGVTYQPYLVQKILDETGAVTKENQPTIAFDNRGWSAEVQEVQQGMRDAVAQPYGTANRLYDLPYKTAGKTGSAQIQNNTKTNAFFVGYGPYDPDSSSKPQIAILVLVEDAKEGSINTLPIAYDVLKWYYEKRL